MRDSGVLTVALLLVLGQAADAATPGHRRLGLWTMRVEELGSSAAPLTSKFCVDRATEAALIKLASDLDPKACPVVRTHPTANGSSADIVCRQGSSIVTSHIVLQVGEATFSSRSDIRTSGPLGRTSKQTILTAARWVGRCPSGMKPGDIVTSSGARLKLGPKGPGRGED